MKIVINTLLLMVGIVATGQQFNEKLVVPLSSPNARGILEVGQVRGNIHVETYAGTEVLIEATASEESTMECQNCDGRTHIREKKANNIPTGMKRISASPIEFSASENNNRVLIETNSWKQALDLKILVPKAFDLEVSTVHGGITVLGISGEMEISAVHGPLEISGVSGSLLCNTVHGDVTVDFVKIAADEPMSFVTLHGDVDVTFPGNLAATAKMKSDRGEIYTDFDMVVDKSQTEKKANSEGGYRVSINSWVYGKINGGGPEYTFKNMQGDIIIRKR